MDGHCDRSSRLFLVQGTGKHAVPLQQTQTHYDVQSLWLTSRPCIRDPVVPYIVEPTVLNMQTLPKNRHNNATLKVAVNFPMPQNCQKVCRRPKAPENATHPKTQKTDHSENLRFRVCFGTLLKGNNEHPKTQIFGTVCFLRFRVCCVFGFCCSPLRKCRAMILHCFLQFYVFGFVGPRSASSTARASKPRLLQCGHYPPKCCATF